MYPNILVCLLLCYQAADALQVSRPKTLSYQCNRLSATPSSSSSVPSIAVVGFSGGSAEAVAYKFFTRGYPVSIILDDEPISPAVKKTINYYCGDLEKQLDDAQGKLHTAASLLQGKIVVVVGDSVPDEDSKTDELAGPLFTKLEKVLPSSTKAIICATGASSETDGNALSNLFGKSGSNVFKKFTSSNSIPLSIVKFGKLTGGIPEAEPIPFMGMPLIEPDVHPSYILRSVVLSTADNKFSAIEPCTRDSLAETIARLVGQQIHLSNDFNAQVISIAGMPPTENDWSTIFVRATTGSNVELLRVDFAEVLKPQALTNWVADVWFPQALIDADAATILTGARPVKANKLPNGNIIIIWEDIQKDLTVRRVGEVEIRLTTGEKPSLRAVRLSSEILPGETQLMEKLIEGVNKQVYKKQLCTQLK